MQNPGSTPGVGIQNGYKMSKCTHSVRGRPTLKDEERFRRSLYERTFMSEHFIEKYVISTELCNVNREKHKLKSHPTER